MSCQDLWKSNLRSSTRRKNKNAKILMRGMVEHNVMWVGLQPEFSFERQPFEDRNSMFHEGRKASNLNRVLDYSTFTDEKRDESGHRAAMGG